MREGRSLDAPPSSWLVPFLLLALRERDRYGQELTQEMARLGFGPIRTGRIYWLLRQMKQERMIVSERGRPRCRSSCKRYSSTALGGECLEFWADSLTKYREETDRFLELYSQGAGTRGWVAGIERDETSLLREGV